MDLKIVDAEKLGAMEGAELEKLVDADLVEFNKFWQTEMENSKLTAHELGVIKTYVWWKTHPPKDSGETPEENQDAR